MNERERRKVQGMENGRRRMIYTHGQNASSVLSKGSEPFLQIITSVIVGRSHVANRSLQVIMRNERKNAPRGHLLKPNEIKLGK